MSWSPEINWETPAGRTLRKLFAVLPPGRPFTLTLFGSSPLQLGLEPTFASNDVDLFGENGLEDYVELTDIVNRAGLGKGQGVDVYIQVCMEENFRTNPRWLDRAWTTTIGEITLTLPHPVDILIAKIHRLDEKDLRAFRLVIERTEHPTEEEMRRELGACIGLFYPSYDEEMAGDFKTNTRVLWQELWGKDINVHREIIGPVREAILKAYEQDRPETDHLQELEKLGNP